MAGAKIKGPVIAIEADTVGVQKGLAQAEGRARALTTEMKAVDRALKIDPENVTLLGQKSQIAEERVSALAERLGYLKRMQEQASTGKDFFGNELSAVQIRAVEREVFNAGEQLKRAQAELAVFNGELDAVKEAADTASDGVLSFAETVKAFVIAELAANVIGTLTDRLLEFAESAPDAAIEFESAFAGVEKTVDGAVLELAELRNGIRQMSLEIPASTDEISAVAAAAGQLGIQTENVLHFSEVMIKLGEATEDLSADTAAEELAQFANITKMAQADFDRLGSTIVQLGNTFATTEGQIVPMATKLASAGTSAGLTEAQIMGLATAMSSMGIEAEAGGTAMSKTLVQIQKAVELGGETLDAYAKTAGMSAAEFKEAWNTDAAGALVEFIAGLSSFEGAGKSAIVVMDELGIKEVRQSDTLRRLTGNWELLQKAIDDSEAAWLTNTALTEEAEKRYQTTESQIALMRNALYDLAITAGEAALPAIREFSVGVRETIEKNEEDISEFSENLGGGLLLAAKNIDVLKNAVLALGPAFAVFKTVELIARINRMNSEVIGLTTAFKGLAAAIGPAGFIAAGVGGFLTLIGTLNDKYPPVITKTQELAKALAKTTEESKKLGEAVEEQIAAFNKSLEDISKQTTENKRLSDEIGALAEAERAALEAGEGSAANRAVILEMVNQLNEAVPGLALAYNAETNELSLSNEERLKYIRNLEAELEFQARLEAQKDIRREMIEIETEINALQRERTELISAGIDEEIENTYIREKSEADYRKAIQASIDAEAALQRQHDELGARVAWLGEMAEETAKSFTETGGEIEESFEGVAEAAVDTTDVLTEEERKQQEVFDSYARHTQNVFGKIEQDAAVSIDTLISNLEENQRAIRDWSENLAELAERGIDEGLLQTFRDAGPEMALTIAELVNVSDEELRELSNAFRNGGVEAREATNRELGIPFDTEFIDKLAEEIENNASIPDAAKIAVLKAREAFDNQVEDSDFEEVGRNIAAGTANGIYNGLQEVVKAASRLGTAVANAAKQELEENSPSKVMAEIGEYAALGMAEGIAEETPAVSVAGAHMAGEFTSTALSELVKGKARIEKELEGFGSSVPKEMRDAKNALEDELKGIEAQIREKRDNFITYGEAVVTAVKEQASERYEAEKAALKEELRIYRDVKYDETALLENYSDDFTRLNEDGLRLIEDLTGERVRLISQSYIEEIALIDEKTAAALNGVNDEINAELEKLFITNRGLYEEIAAIREKKAELEKAHEAELRRREEEETARRLAELIRRIDEAETAERRMEAQDDYYDYLKQLDEKAADTRYREEMARLEALERERIESARRVAEEAARLQEEALKGAEALLSAGEAEYESVKGAEIQDAFDEAVKYAAQAAVDIIKAGPETAKEILAAYNPDWAMAGKSFIEFFEAGTKEMEPAAVETLYDIGDNVISGFIQGLRDREAEVRETVRSILAEAEKVARATLDLHSPSKKFREMGFDTGRGFEFGLLDVAPLINRAAEKLGMASIYGVSNVTENNAYNHGAVNNMASNAFSSVNNVTNYAGDSPVYLTIENFYNSGAEDIETLSEEFAECIDRKRRLRGG